MYQHKFSALVDIKTTQGKSATITMEINHEQDLQQFSHTEKLVYLTEILYYEISKNTIFAFGTYRIERYYIVWPDGTDEYFTNKL